MSCGAGGLRLLAPTRWRHGDTALMCLSTSQIGYSWLMQQNTLPPAYINFLNRHGGAEVFQYRAVQAHPPPDQLTAPHVSETLQ